MDNKTSPTKNIQENVTDQDGTSTKDSVLSIDTKDLPETTHSAPNTVDTTSSSTTVDSTSTTLDITITAASAQDFIPFVPYKAKKAASPRSYLIPALVFIVASSIPSLLRVHNRYTMAPLTQPGQILPPGSWRSQCGLFHLFPNKLVADIQTPYESINQAVASLLLMVTSSAYCPVDIALSVHMSKNGTTLEVYRDAQVIYALIGQSCIPEITINSTVLQSFSNTLKPATTTTTSCVPGAKVSETGAIEIGGQAPLYAILYDTEPQVSILNDLYSWPFGANVIVPLPPTLSSSSETLKKPAQHSNNKPKHFKFPWEDLKILIVWPWEKREIKDKKHVVDSNNNNNKPKDFKFPWEDIKV